MIARIDKSSLFGQVNIPSSKSATHRAIISAALAFGQSKIYSVTLSDDILATVNALISLGADIQITKDYILVNAINPHNKEVVIDCKESGSTLRFLIPIAAALGISATFTGSGRLPQRPLDDIVALLRQNGVECNDKLPLHIKGKLKAGKYHISGAISSQFITGLMYALSTFDEQSEIIITDKLQSKGYVDMTAQSLTYFGCKIQKTELGYLVCGKPQARDVSVEGDFSQAAFYLQAAALNSQIKIKGLDKNSLQGDKQCVELFEKIGVKIDWQNSIIAKADTLNAIDIDASQIPDLVPALAVTLAFANGKSVIYNASRLRIKESDRLNAVASNLNKMGIKTQQTEDSLTIFGGNPHSADLDGFNDHRIVMAFSIALAKCGGSITDCEAINKSYPQFFEHFKLIGGNYRVL